MPSSFSEPERPIAAASPARPPDCWLVPNVHQPAQKCPRRHDHGRAVILHFQRRFDPKGRAVACRILAICPCLTSRSRLAFANPFQPKLVGLLVALRAWRPNGRSFLGVEHPELQAGHIGRLAHLAAQRVNLASEMAFGQSADGRIAGHLADGVGIDGQQQRRATHPRRGQRRFDSGMAGPDDNHVIFLRINEHGSSCLLL